MPQVPMRQDDVASEGHYQFCAMTPPQDSLKQKQRAGLSQMCATSRPHLLRRGHIPVTKPAYTGPKGWQVHVHKDPPAVASRSERAGDTQMSCPTSGPK